MKAHFILLFILMLLLESCYDENGQGYFPIGVSNEFQYGLLNSSENKVVRFSITEINDSRCPSDVVCVWQGKAEIKLEIEAPQQGLLVLNTYDNVKDSIGNHSFELIDVSPYPISTQILKTDDYTVTLLIEEL